MPPWRTVDDTRAEGKPVSLTTMASASSAAFLCCTSKSGGTYSASITGVSGSTLTKRIMPPDGPAIINAAATAGLARSGSARSIGTRIFLYMAPSHSLTWFSDILPRLPADRESGAPPMPPSAVAQAPWPRGANGPPPLWRQWGKPHARHFDGREWGKPHARSDPIRPCQRGGAHEALEPSAVGMQLAPVLAGKIDHREAGRRQPLIESLAGLDVARGDQPPRRVMQPRIVSDHQQRAHRRRGLLHERDDRLGAGVVEALLVNDARGLRQRGGDALPRLPRAFGRRHQHEVGGERMTGHVAADHRGIVFAARIEAARVVAHAGFGLFRLGVSKQHQAHGSSINVPRGAG